MTSSDIPVSHISAVMDPNYEAQLPRHKQPLSVQPGPYGQQGIYGAPAYKLQEETHPLDALAGDLLANRDGIVQLLAAVGVHRIPTQAITNLGIGSAAIHSDVDRRVALESSQAVATYKRSHHHVTTGHRTAQSGGAHPQALDRAAAYEAQARGKAPVIVEQDRAGTSQSAPDPKPSNNLPSRFGGRGGRGGRGGMRSVAWNLRVEPRVSSVLPRDKVVHMMRPNPARPVAPVMKPNLVRVP